MEGAGLHPVKITNWRDRHTGRRSTFAAAHVPFYITTLEEELKASLLPPKMQNRTVVILDIKFARIPIWDAAL